MKTSRITTSLLAFALLAAACNGGDDDDDAAKEPAAVPGTYSCDISSSTSGHYCSGLTYDSGELTGDEKGWCDEDNGAYSTRACPNPAVGCVCTYGMPMTASGGPATGVQVTYFTPSQVATADAKENSFIYVATWCGAVGAKLGSTGTIKCFGMGAPYDDI